MCTETYCRLWSPNISGLCVCMCANDKSTQTFAMLPVGSVMVIQQCRQMNDLF